MSQAWRALSAICIIYFITGGTVLYGISVVLKPLIHDMGWTRAQGTSGITVLLLSVGFLGPVASALIDRFNIRITLLIGAVSIIMGGITGYFTQGLLQYYLALVLLGFGCASMTLIPLSQIVARWFSRHRGLAMGLLFTSAGLGAFIITPLFALVLEHTGNWRLLFAIMAATAPISMIVTVLMLRNNPMTEADIDGGGGTVAQSETHKTRVYQANISWNISAVLRVWPFWIVVAASSMSMIGFSLVNSQAILHLTDMGIREVMAGTAIGAMGLCSVAGRLGGGILGDRLEPKLLLTLGLFFQAAGILALSFANSDILVYSFALLFGIGLGLGLVTAPLILANYFGVGSLARINAIATAFTIILGGFMPTIAGYARDTLGNYTLVFCTFSLVAIVLAVPLALMKPPGHRNLQYQPHEDK